MSGWMKYPYQNCMWQGRRWDKMTDRDWQADWDWTNDPDVCIKEGKQELVNRCLKRVRSLEDFLGDVQRIVGRSLEKVIQEKTAAELRARKLEEENRRLRDALHWIAQQLHDKRYGSRRCAETDWCITEYCLSCYAKATLAILDSGKKEAGAQTGKEE